MARGPSFRLPAAASEWSDSVGELLRERAWPEVRAELARAATEEPSRDALALFAAAAHLALRDVPSPPTDPSPDAIPHDRDRREAERAATAARSAQAWVERVKLRWPKLVVGWLLVGRCALWLGDPGGALGAFRRAALLTSRKDESGEERAATSIVRTLDGCRETSSPTALEVWTEAVDHGLRSSAWGEDTFRTRVMGDVIAKESLPRGLRRRALEARAFSRGGRGAIDDLRDLIRWRAEDGDPPRLADHLRLARELFAGGDEAEAVESVRAAQSIDPERTGEVLASTELRDLLGSEALWISLGGASPPLDRDPLHRELQRVHGGWLMLAGRGQLGALRGDDIGAPAMAAAARAFASATTLGDPPLLIEAMSHLGALIAVYRKANLGVRWLERAAALAETALAAEPLRRAEVLHRLGVGQLWCGQGKTIPGGAPAPEIQHAATSLEGALSLRLEHGADPLALAHSYGELARIEVARRRFPEAAERLDEARSALLRGLEELERALIQEPSESRASRRLDALGNLALVTTQRAEVALELRATGEELTALVDDAIEHALRAHAEGLSFEAVPPRLAQLVAGLPAPRRAARRKRLARLTSTA